MIDEGRFMINTLKASVVGGVFALQLMAGLTYGQSDAPLTHFIVVAPTGNNMTVLLQGSVIPTVNGTPIASGDEIGIFTTAGICVGGAVWNGTTVPITVWGTDLESQQTDGMAVGEKLQYRIWQAEGSKECLAFATYNTSSPFSRSDSTYAINGVSVLASLNGIPAPGAPAISIPANSAVGVGLALSLNWNASPTALTYAIQVSTNSSFSTTLAYASGLTGTTFPLSGLWNMVSYYWQVRATNQGGCSGWSGVAGFTTGSHFAYTGTTGNNMTVLAKSTLAPTIDGAAIPSGDEIGIFTPAGLCVGTAVWNNVTTIITVWGNNGETLPVDGMMPGEKLNYRLWDCALGREFLAVAAYNTADPFSRSDSTYVVNGVSVLSALSGYSPPASPSPASPANGFAAAAVPPALAWAAGGGGPTSSYTIRIATASDFSTTVITQAALTAVSVVTGASLNYGTLYYWQVNSSGPGGTSAWSACWDFTTNRLLTIPLVPGWNMTSFNIHPLDSSVEGIFGSPAGFLFVKDVQGDAYIPEFGIDNLNTLHTGIGYQVYTQGYDTITIIGAPVDVGTTAIQLQEGWNIIAYLPQTAMDAAVAFAGIADALVIAKDNGGAAYLPELEINDIGALQVGQGYMVYASQPIAFTYPAGTAKRAAAAGTMLKLPAPQHFGVGKKNTGNNATLVACAVTVAGKPAPDGSEIGAFDEQGMLVGAGSVLHGRSAFALWGKDPQTKEKDGCAIGEMIHLKLWDSKQELPIYLQSGKDLQYEVGGIFKGVLASPGWNAIAGFNLSAVYPNPFRNSVRISFDVPALNGCAASEVEINAFDMQGTLVRRIAKEKYQPGHYAVSWDGSAVGNVALSPGFYLIAMKTPNFEKRIRVIKIH